MPHSRGEVPPCTPLNGGVPQMMLPSRVPHPLHWLYVWPILGGVLEFKELGFRVYELERLNFGLKT